MYATIIAKAVDKQRGKKDHERGEESPNLSASVVKGVPTSYRTQGNLALDTQGSCQEPPPVSNPHTELLAVRIV